MYLFDFGSDSAHSMMEAVAMQAVVIFHPFESFAMRCSTPHGIVAIHCLMMISLSRIVYFFMTTLFMYIERDESHVWEDPEF